MSCHNTKRSVSHDFIMIIVGVGIQILHILYLLATKRAVEGRGEGEERGRVLLVCSGIGFIRIA